MRVFKAPDSLLDETEYPYQVLVTRYMQPSDQFKLRLLELPYAARTCKQDMLDSIKITVDDYTGEIKTVRFLKLKAK